jgi:hypothetical protein
VKSDQVRKVKSENRPSQKKQKVKIDQVRKSKKGPSQGSEK